MHVDIKGKYSFGYNKVKTYGTETFDTLSQNIWKYINISTHTVMHIFRAKFISI